MTEDRFKIDGGKRALFVRGGSAGWVVWFDDGAADFSGIQIGAGRDRDQAIRQAIEVLLEGVRILRGEVEAEAVNTA